MYSPNSKGNCIKFITIVFIANFSCWLVRHYMLTCFPTLTNYDKISKFMTYQPICYYLSQKSHFSSGPYKHC